MSILPRNCQRYLNNKNITYYEPAEAGVSAVVIDPWKLPKGKFDHENVALMLLLPDGYPDASPDMFYVHPWIRLLDAEDWPSAAAVKYSFDGKDWQRWSRHWGDWRPGIDGIQTLLRKVDHALQISQ